MFVALVTFVCQGLGRNLTSETEGCPDGGGGGKIPKAAFLIAVTLHLRSVWQHPIYHC